MKASECPVWLDLEQLALHAAQRPVGHLPGPDAAQNGARVEHQRAKREAQEDVDPGGSPASRHRPLGSVVIHLLDGLSRLARTYTRIITPISALYQSLAIAMKLGFADSA